MKKNSSASKIYFIIKKFIDIINIIKEIAIFNIKFFVNQYLMSLLK